MTPLLCELPLRELLKDAGLELSAKSDPPGDSTSEAWWGLKTAEGGPDQFATVIVPPLRTMSAEPRITTTIGIRTVWVTGEVVFADVDPTGRYPNMVLRRSHLN